MRMKYAPPTKKRISRQLVKGSIPTIFAYQTTVNSRKTSLERSEKAEKIEVNFHKRIIHKMSVEHMSRLSARDLWSPSLSF